MITSGALTAIDILCRALTQPGDVVVVEDPTFYFVAQVLRMSHVEVVSVPLCERWHRPRRAAGADATATASG